MPNLRADRTLTLALARPARRLLHLNRDHQIPILMYHGIRTAMGSRHPYFETNTSPQVFAAHMAFLRANNYKTVKVSEAVEHLKENDDGQKRVVITFDDGYLDFYTNALPILMDHGFTATMFIVSSYAARSGSSRAEEFMTWEQIRTIQSNGIEVGSHTVSHRRLWELSRLEIEYELRQSKETIEDEVGRPIREFAYPFAFPEQNKAFAETARTLLKQCGYENAVSTIVGTASVAHAKYCLPRLPANSHDDRNLFQAKLEGAYDWIHAAQRTYKSFKRNSRSAPVGKAEPKATERTA